MGLQGAWPKFVKETDEDQDDGDGDANTRYIKE